MTKQEFGIKCAQLLRPFAREYGLDYYPVDECVTVLIGNHFALRFGSSFADTNLSYWLLRGRKLLDYDVHDYFARKASQYDSNDIIWKEGCFEYAYNEVQLFVNTLRNQWGDLLKGDTSWMEDYRRSEDWDTPEIAHGTVAEKVKEILLAKQHRIWKKHIAGSTME